MYFTNDSFRILIRISLKFVPKGPVDNESVLAQVMAWGQTGDRVFSEPMVTRFTDVQIAALGEMS